ncbi:MAG: DUF4270 family protein [Bacteroidia bacterium]|nr:DUF4270 family protein [Bacteroidia bacterium]
MRNKIIAIFGAIILFAVWSCSDEALITDSGFMKTDTRAELTDEVPIQLSTFKLDSVITSSQGVVWVGKAKKPVIGDICSESFIKLAPPAHINDWQWLEKERYDSVEIVLRHTGSYEGDTMQNLIINVSHLNKVTRKNPLNQEEIDSIYNYIKMVEHQTAFYNADTSFHAGALLGKHLFKPRPHGKARINFRLDDNFGKELVKFVKKFRKEDIIGAEKYFQEYVMGGINISFEDNAKSLCAFLTDSVKIILHSHISGINAIKRQRVMTVENKKMQFNKVWNENVDEPFQALQNRWNNVTEVEGDNHSFVFEGLGYYTRINFPSLESVTSKADYAHIAKATLTLFAEKGSFDKRRIPVTFFLSTIGRSNETENAIPVVNSTHNTVYAQLHYDPFDQNYVYYTYDLTYYINSRLNQDIVSTDGLFLTWSPICDPMNYSYMVFNGHNMPQDKKRFRSKLDIIYYYFDREER